ncbi:MAG: type I glutamate--ammonia ligase [Candidatus Edwardsbacteria bacterium]
MKQTNLIKKVENDRVKFIHLQFTDILGTIKNVTKPVEHLPRILEEGVWFDGSSIEGFARICESDMLLVPDLSTYHLLPWSENEKRAARIICDIQTINTQPFEGDPRYILKRMLKKAKEKGYIYNTGPEVEFFLLQKIDGRPKPVPHDVGGYFDFSPHDPASEVREETLLALKELGINGESSQHEVAGGQHEIDIRYADALTSADNVMTLKYTIRAIAHRHDLYTTFMPKPIFGINGSGMHTHQSLFNTKGENLFFARDDRYKLSKLAYSFIAGQLAHAKALAAIVAQTVNSYKRLVPGYEAPVYICWGQVNRSALIRIPRYSKGREQATRAELRCPDPCCNPYLAFACMLAAGLDGVEKRMKPPEPVEENVYHFDDQKLKELSIDSLPGSLEEALNELEKDKVLLEALGSHTAEKLLQAKKTEWNDYRTQVTPWELQEYLEF